MSDPHEFQPASISVTIRDVLELPVFKNGEPVLLAGERHLDRHIRWVHISDLPTAAPSLKGGELLLTHGLGLRDSRATQRRYVQDLARVPIAGLVIELGRVFTEVPETIVSEAQRHDLPLVALRKRILFVDVTEHLHAAIISRHNSHVEYAQSVGRDVVALAAAGGSVAAVLRALAAAVGNPVVLEDAAHQVVDFAPHQRDISGVLAEWQTHSRRRHVGGTLVPEHADAVQVKRCVAEPIRLKNQHWGYIHVLELDSPLPAETSLAVQQCAAGLTIALLQEASLTDLATHSGSRFIADVLRGDLSEGEVIALARSLGVDFDGLVTAVVIEVDALDGRTAHTSRAIIERVTRCAQAALRENSASSLGRADARRALLVVGVRDEDDLRTSVTHAVERIDADLTASPLRARIGVSEPAAADRLSAAFEHAREAATLARGDGRAEVAWYGQLGVDGLLMRLADGPELPAFVESELGPLLEHDALEKSKLLPVLEVYLETGCSKSEAARALFMARRSLYYRLETIEKLLGRSLDDSQCRIELAVAIQGLKTLQRRSRS